MKANEQIIEVCGKKVLVRYIEHLSPCPPCVFYEEGCTCSEYCRKFDRGDEIAYFVEAEYPQEKDDKEFCKDNCKGYQETGRCFADGDCKAKQEGELKANITLETDFEVEYTRYMESRKDDVSGHAVTINIKDLARHFAEWERKRILDKSVEWMKKNLTYVHPRKEVETCMVNIPIFLDAMNE